MTIHTCPHCELRFASATELEWHLAEDHGEEWAGSDKRPRPRPGGET